MAHANRTVRGEVAGKRARLRVQLGRPPPGAGDQCLRQVPDAGDSRLGQRAAAEHGIRAAALLRDGAGEPAERRGQTGDDQHDPVQLDADGAWSVLMAARAYKVRLSDGTTGLSAGRYSFVPAVNRSD